MTKITIERETLELAIAALTYHQTQTRPIESTRITLETLRALLAAQPPTVDGHLKCGHHQSLAINSAETGEFLYCDLCDAKSRCRDAEAMEAELRAALAAQPAQPADAQPTGQSPCARHCEAPAFEGEIRRLKRELQTQAERIRLLREALVIIKANAGEAEQVYTVARAALEATK